MRLWLFIRKMGIVTYHVLQLRGSKLPVWEITTFVFLRGVIVVIMHSIPRVIRYTKY